MYAGFTPAKIGCEPLRLSVCRLFFARGARLKTGLFLGKGDFVKQLLFVHRLDLHEDPESLISAFILANGEGLAPFRGTLVDDIKF